MSVCFVIPAVEEKVVTLAPEFTTKLEDVHTTDGGKAQFTVVVTGQPKPEVTWYKDNTLVEEAEEFQITHEGDVSTLTIPDVYPEDAGTYKVVAKNEVGSVTSTAVLFVESMYSFVIGCFILFVQFCLACKRVKGYTFTLPVKTRKFSKILIILTNSI